MMMVMPTARDGLGQILNIGQLAGLGGIGEVRRQGAELVRRGRIAVRLGGLGRILQVRGDLLCDLLVLRRIRLLKLLEDAHQLGER